MWMDKVAIGQLTFTNDKHIIALQLISKPCEMLLPNAGHKAAELGANKNLQLRDQKKRSAMA